MWLLHDDITVENMSCGFVYHIMVNCIASAVLRAYVNTNVSKKVIVSGLDRLSLLSYIQVNEKLQSGDVGWCKK